MSRSLNQCIIDGCDRQRYGHGWCRLHWGRWKRQGDPLALATFQGLTVEQRFLQYVDRTDSCWLWTGGINQHGYSKFWDGQKLTSGHRTSFALFVGPLVDGMEIDHLCRVRHCVNPAHLEQVTPRTNVVRSVSPAAINAAKTECASGHPLAGENLILSPEGYRYCRECRRRWAREYQRRRRSKVAQ